MALRENKTKTKKSEQTNEQTNKQNKTKAKKRQRDNLSEFNQVKTELTTQRYSVIKFFSFDFCKDF